MTPKRDFFSAFKAPASRKPVPLLPTHHAQQSSPSFIEEDESTDFKLAILQSLFPDKASSVLLELLLSCDGSIETASELAASHEDPRKRLATAFTGNQSSLSTFLTHSSPTTSKTASKKMPFILPPVPKGKTLHLTTPELVPYHTPCTLHPSFLPSALATSLLQELIVEAATYGRQSFRLFDRTVSSPHSACFYVSDLTAALKQKNEYMYNGSFLEDIRPFTSTMSAIIAMVEDKVNAEVTKRAKEVYPGGRKLKHQIKLGQWKVNTAFVNCYDGAKESVGWHSDSLTYLGPMAIIASISLGVEREFRLRRVAARNQDESNSSTLSNTASVLSDTNIQKEAFNKNDEKDSSNWTETEGAASIHLPHNSLLIMHAGTQESYKHSVHPAAKLTPHPVAANKRINITYRCYRESLHPSLTPKCSCGVPCVLRSVQRKQDNVGKYFWMCHAGNAPDGKGCTFFEWAEFDEDGEPIWPNDKCKHSFTIGERGMPMMIWRCLQCGATIGGHDHNLIVGVMPTTELERWFGGGFI